MDHQPCVFISWSGEKGRKVAESLHSWLSYIFDHSHFWLSSKDIHGGSRWSAELFQQLETSKLGILIITPESLDAPWIMFEAGALSTSLMAKRRVVPYLVEEFSLIDPLAQFQSIQADQNGTRHLVTVINDALDVRYDPPIVEKRFAKAWRELEETIDAIRAEYAEGPRSEQPQSALALDYGALQKQLSDLIEDNRVLQKQVGALSDLVQQVVERSPVMAGLKILEGAWVNKDCNTHIYIAFVNGNLLAPYCYRGNDRLTAECYDWKRIGDYLHARFRWMFRQEVSGFAFFRLISNDVLEGAWWSSSGAVRLRWERSLEATPTWASEYFEAQRVQSTLEAGV